MAGEMSREEFLRSVLQEMSPEALQQLAGSGEALFHAAAKAANDGDHTHDFLGDSAEQIAKVAASLLNQRQQQG